MRNSQITDANIRYEGIDDSPQLISATDWDLSDPKVNRERAKAFLNHNPEVLETYPAAKLMRVVGSYGGQYALIGRNQILEYFMHYETRAIPGLGRCATQVKVWRMRTASITNMAATVFDVHLLADFNTIVSDSQQTPRGMEFWQVQLGGHGHTKAVGMVVGNTIKLYDPDLDMGEWLAIVGGWGKESFNRAVRFFISNIPRDTIASTSGV